MLSKFRGLSQWRGKLWLAVLGAVLGFSSACTAPRSQILLDGQAIFKANCSSYHTIGGGNLAGPDLKGVTEQEEQKWLINFISDPNLMITSGDARANELLKQFNYVVMPNMGLSRDQVSAVITFITAESGLVIAPTPGGTPEAGLIPGNPENGKAIFLGEVHLQNGGPFCIGCNWSTGKSEKCILCYPRQETGQAPACFHVCVGRIRYLGVLLYHADRIEQVAKSSTEELANEQLKTILNPADPEVVAAARRNRIPDGVIEAAQKSPVYRFVKEWKLALPLHPEFRTMPMLFYVPPLLPVVLTELMGGVQRLANDFFSSLENARMPLQYMARLFAAGQVEPIKKVYQKLLAVRSYKRAETVGDLDSKLMDKAMLDAGLTAQEINEIFYLTTKTNYYENFVIPPMGRETAIEAISDAQEHKQEAGFGFRQPPQRGS